MSKTFLFAGASSAIAKETARLLQTKGHSVIGISTKEKSFEYNDFFKIEKYNFGVFPSIDNALDGIVYFPGTINLKPFSRLSAAEFTADWQINALGAVAFTQTYLPNLKKVPTAAMVFVSTVAVSVGLPFHASIGMAKAAVEGLTKSLAAELAPSIRVNCVAPSLVQSPLGDKFVNTPEKMEAMEKRNPLKKVGSPLDVANAISFLLNEEANWITGQIIAVDGGMNSLKI